MNVGVLGACGFIGRNMVNELENQGYSVQCLDSVDLKLFKDLSLVDITNLESIIKATKNCDVLINLDASPLIKSTSDPVSDVATNVLGNVNVFEACKINKIKSVVFSSASSLYGKVETSDVAEDHSCTPRTPYGVSKFACEHYLRVFNELYGLNFTVFRFFNVYGPLQAGGSGRIIPNLLDNISNGKKIQIYGDGKQIRDFIYVVDICRYITKLLSLTSPNDVFNMGTGTATNIIDLVKLCGEIVNKTPDIEFLPARPGEIGNFTANTEKLKGLFGDLSFTDLRDGLQSTWSSKNP